MVNTQQLALPVFGQVLQYGDHTVVNSAAVWSFTVLVYGDYTVVNVPEGRPRMSDVSPLSEISGLSFDCTLPSPL